MKIINKFNSSIFRFLFKFIINTLNICEKFIVNPNIPNEIKIDPNIPKFLIYILSHSNVISKFIPMNHL